jgi:hypothetical protein
MSDRILVVDDEEPIREIVSALLGASRKFRRHRLSSGAEGGGNTTRGGSSRLQTRSTRLHRTFPTVLDSRSFSFREYFVGGFLSALQEAKKPACVPSP